MQKKDNFTSTTWTDEAGNSHSWSSAWDFDEVWDINENINNGLPLIKECCYRTLSYQTSEDDETDKSITQFNILSGISIESKTIDGQTITTWTDGVNTYQSGELIMTFEDNVTLWPFMTCELTLNITINNLNSGGVIIYLMNESVIEKQLYLTKSQSLIYEFDQGLNFNIIVSKNYMWNMSFSGSGTFQNNIYSFITEGDTQTHNITINASSTNLNNSIVV